MRTPVVYSRITFQHPFSLKGLLDVQPAGTYSIETRERHNYLFPFSWEKETKTTVRLCKNSGLEGNIYDFQLDPIDLFWALERDRLFAATTTSKKQKGD